MANFEKRKVQLMENLMRTFGLNESKKQRVQVSRDEIFSILDKIDDDPKSRGRFASVTYVKPVSFYRTKEKWRTNDVADALRNNADRSEEEWYQQLSRFNEPDLQGRKARTPIKGAVMVIHYLFHWHTKKQYDQQHSDYSEKLHNLRMSFGVALDSDGMLGDNHNQRTKSDATQSMVFNQTGNAARDFNMSGAKVTATTYFVDENGNIIAEVPEDIIRAISALPSPKKAEKAVREKLSPEELEIYMGKKQELDVLWDAKNLLFDRTLAICAGVDGVSYFYINDALKTNIAEKSTVIVNPETMRRIAEKELDETFEAIDTFAQDSKYDK